MYLKTWPDIKVVDKKEITLCVSLVNRIKIEDWRTGCVWDVDKPADDFVEGPLNPLWYVRSSNEPDVHDPAPEYRKG